MAKVLVSDDDPQILRLVGLVLERAGHEVITTSSPHDVLELASQNGIDAVVLDVVMPEVSGFELLEELRHNPDTADIPILFLSGLGAGADRVRGLSQGADDYLVKPFEPDELVLRVERLISWRQRQPGSREKPAVGLGDDVGSATGGETSDKRYFGRYEVSDKIGAGSMGTVYRGWDPRLERRLALKSVPLDSTALGTQRQELLELLRHEAVTIAKFSHPNIVAVYDMGDAAGSAFVAMELIDGVSMAHYLQQNGAIPPKRLIPLAIGIVSGLIAAHENGVIHRDVKPSNVLLGRDGSIKVTDFGLAYVMSGATSDSTQLYGTPGFVPPEALADEPYTKAGDLFGLGATLYQALTGRHPLAGANLRETILNTMRGEVKPITEEVPDIPSDLADLVMGLLSVDDKSRPLGPAVLERLKRAAAVEDLHWTADDLPSPDA